MIRIPRWLVGTLGILFALFHAGLGFSTLSESSNQPVALLALVIYLATVLPTVLLYPGVRLPVPQAIINLAAASIIPILVNAYLEPSQMSAYSTWYVMGISSLMTATVIRQQRAIGWAGTVILIIQVILWAGVAEGIQTGLPGALMLVFAGHAISVGLARAYRETMQYNKEALDIELEQTANSVASEVRRSRLEAALGGTAPILKLIVAQHGKLSEHQKIEAKLLEASLRDEIRGRTLMNETIREAVRAARKRGIEVTVLDEGGLDSASDFEKVEILNEVVAAIDTVQEGKVTLRSPAGEPWRVTLVASRTGVATPDLWLKF